MTNYEGSPKGDPAAAGAEAGGVARPRALFTPPPDPAEALYYEGMAAYQHRNWEQALERFGRLKELQPSRPGLDALLDEVRWFLQLQAAAPAAPANGSATPREAGANAAATGKPAGAGSRSRWQTSLVILLAVIGILALVLIATQGRLPWNQTTDRQAQELYNRGQTRLAVGDYEGAQDAFKKVLEIAPSHPEAQLGLSRAQRQQTLAQGYAAAEAAIAEENWDEATAELAKILATDASYSDAQAKADMVAQRRSLSGLYADASRLYDLAQWQEAIAQFERVRALDSTYRSEAVQEFLFVCYLNAGQALVDSANGQVAPLQQAVEYLSNALAIHPRNRPATDARRLASLYLDAARAVAAGNAPEAQARLAILTGEVSTYANGQAAKLLYDVMLRRAQQALDSGDIPGAVQMFQSAQAVAVPDHSAAASGELLARSITPTPLPTLTPLATVTPVRPTSYAVVRSGAINLRSGPGTAYAVAGQANAGESLTIMGRSADGAWLQVCAKTAPGSPSCSEQDAAWVTAALVDSFGLDLVALVTPQPLPVAPVPASTPTPSGLVMCVTGQVRDAANQNPLAGWNVGARASDGFQKVRKTDGLGTYRIAGLDTGSYVVSVYPEAGWRPVSPESSPVVLPSGNTCVTVDFWVERIPSGGSAPTSQPPSATPEPRATATPAR